MTLGPSYCKKCMCMLEGGHGPPGPYWRCPKCNIDCFHKDSAYLFGCTEEELDIVLKDNPRLRQVMRDICSSRGK